MDQTQLSCLESTDTTPSQLDASDAVASVERDFARTARTNATGAAQTSANGNRRDLLEAWDVMRKRLLSIAHSIVRRPEDAQDVCNDVLLAAWSINQDQGVEQPRQWEAWLTQAVRNKALTLVKSRRWGVDGDAALLQLTVDSGEADIATRMLAEWLRGQCTSDRDKRLCTALEASENMTVAAEAMGLSRQHMYRELARLQAKFGVVVVKARRVDRSAKPETNDIAASGACRRARTTSIQVAVPRHAAEQSLWEMSQGYVDEGGPAIGDSIAAWLDIAVEALRASQRLGVITLDEWAA